MLHSQGIDEIKCEHQRVDNTGYVFWAVTEVQMIVDPYVRVVKAFLLIKDIDKEKKQAIKLKQLSETDWLTGLFVIFIENIGDEKILLKKIRFATM